MEKGGLTAALAAAGVTAGPVVGVADELRLGLIGQTRKVWAPAGIDAIVWDGAPAHHTRAALPQPVTFVHQPPHSPQLNPAERLFEEPRRHLAGQVYPTRSAKYLAAHLFLEEVDAGPDRLRRLVGWDWITETLAALPPYEA